MNKCAECKTPLTLDNIVCYDATFSVCKSCEVSTSADWAERKAELKAEGFDVDKCTSIEQWCEGDEAKAKFREQADRFADNCLPQRKDYKGWP